MRFLLLLSSLVLACDFSFKDNVCGNIEWDEGPRVNNLSRFRIKFTQFNNPYTPKKLNIYTWMVMDNGHSHGGPKLNWEETYPGEYLIDNARFFMRGMKGYWQVRVEMEDELQSIKVVL